MKCQSCGATKEDGEILCVERHFVERQGWVDQGPWRAQYLNTWIDEIEETNCGSCSLMLWLARWRADTVPLVT
jgi:hypothetical protein